MEYKRRWSMNTSLKNARIFDEDSGDDLMSGSHKKEIKTEKQDVECPPPPAIKAEDMVVTTPIKCELFDEDTNFGISADEFANIHIKKEDIEELTSPTKMDFDDSNSRKSFKSAKLSYKKRDSPYKTVFERLGPSPSKVPNLNLDEKTLNQRKRKTRKNEMETDPLILKRRQKQIDYGKNTIGYDQYRKIVPKQSRTVEDPQTPDKFMKYSRRGWDGLIKQWRLKLHKYDPEDT